MEKEGETIAHAIMRGDIEELSYWRGRYKSYAENFTAELKTSKFTDRDVQVFKVSRVHAMLDVLLGSIKPPTREGEGQSTEGKPGGPYV